MRRCSISGRWRWVVLRKTTKSAHRGVLGAFSQRFPSPSRRRGCAARSRGSLLPSTPCRRGEALTSGSKTHTSGQTGYWRRPLLGIVGTGLDVIAVWVEHKSAIVVRMVLLTRPRLAVILRPRCHCGFVECPHRFAVGRAEGDVHRLFVWTLFELCDPEVRLPPRAQACEALELHHDGVAERGERLGEKSLAPFVIADTDSEVVDHVRRA